MANFPASASGSGEVSIFPSLRKKYRYPQRGIVSKKWMMLAGVVLFASLAIAQNAPQVAGVDPAAGKVNDTVTLSGDHLGKGSVSSVFLSDDKNDFKATIVDQSDDKISMKVPQVKPGDYNISVQVGDKLFIKPVKFKVQE